MSRPFVAQSTLAAPSTGGSTPGAAMDSNVGGHLGTFPNWHCRVICPPGCRQTLQLEVACHDGPLQTHKCWWRWRVCDHVSFAAVVCGVWAWRSNGPPSNPLRSQASTHKTLLND